MNTSGLQKLLLLRLPRAGLKLYPSITPQHVGAITIVSFIDLYAMAALGYCQGAPYIWTPALHLLCCKGHRKTC